MKIIHHGAHQGVTGSCHQLFIDDDRSVLVDCGIFQGSDAKRHPSPEIDFSLQGISALLLTHVHIDHCGRLPYLLGAGFDRPIYCSEPTAKLLPIVMADALKIGFTRSKRLIKKFQSRIGELLRPLPYGHWQDIDAGCQIRLATAGHVLGSTIFEVKLPDGKIVVFSGDLGAGNNPLLNPPTSPDKADLLVLESTYGDRNHDETIDRQNELERVIRKTLENNGVTIIPAFSLGRTQALLYELNGIFERVQKTENRSLMKRIDVIVDSPLASRFTSLYREMKEHWGREAQFLMQTDDQPLVFENLMTVGSHGEHLDTVKYLKERKLPAIIVAGSGMCTGGRVVRYLQNFLGDRTTDVIFVGYQAHGTPGYYLSRGSDWVYLNGRKVGIRAAVHRIHGYSAHAGQRDLIAFVENMAHKPAKIRLVHGDREPKRVLTKLLEQRGYQVD